jgi:hypothetical protein
MLDYADLACIRIMSYVPVLALSCPTVCFLSFGIARVPLEYHLRLPVLITKFPSTTR